MTSAEPLALPPFRMDMSYVGVRPIVLTQVYDERQQWFPFVNAIFRCHKPPSSSKLVPPQDWIRCRANKPMIHVPSDLSGMYEYHRGVEQITLPFYECRRINELQLIHVRAIRYPGFERLAGEVQHYLFGQSNRSKVTDWCEEHCSGRFGINSRSVVFEKCLDATFAILSLGLVKAQKRR